MAGRPEGGNAPTAAVCFYRAYVQSGETRPVEMLIEALAAEGVRALPLFVSSLKEPVSIETVRDAFAEIRPEVVLNATPRRQAMTDQLGRTSRLGVLGIKSSGDFERRRYGPLESVGRGFVQTKDGTKPVYDGLVYVFSNEAEATKALRAMEGDVAIAKLLNKEPGGIHIMYADRSGAIQRLEGR